jgi:spore germination cell wall hydrolase CwlJ-like protein
MTMKFLALYLLMYLLMAACCAGADVEIVAATIVAESGGEGLMGMAAVHEVISTRARERHLSESQVCLQKWQFSCLNGVQPSALIAKAKLHPRWKQAVREAQGAATTHYAKGANSYLAPKSLKKLPAWAQESKRVAIIGNHHFFKL